jgi:hypothetical protein
MPIFVRELTQAYNARHAGHAPDWQPLPLQYRDVAAWLDRQMALGVHAADAAYWRAELAGELPLLDLPTDQPRPAVRGYHGATHSHPLPASSVRARRQRRAPWHHPLRSSRQCRCCSHACRARTTSLSAYRWPAVPIRPAKD